MNKFQRFCINALKLFILLALVLVLINSVKRININNSNLFLYQLTALIVVSSLGGIFIINSKMVMKFKLLTLLFIALLLRVWWVLNVNSVPVSDFNTMYLSAKDLLNGNIMTFRDYGYLSRFPHLICTTLYMALMIVIFPTYHLVAIKIVNVILSVVSVFLLYKLSEYFLKTEKGRLFIMLLAAVFPPFISYSSTYCTENIAIPIYLLTVLWFLGANKNKTDVRYFVVGIFLAISNVFRGVGLIFLIAFVIYILIFTDKCKIKYSLLLIGGMTVASVIISLFLISINIIDKPLWQGAEPSFATLLLKGSNVENGGRWNLEDAQFVDRNLRNTNLASECVKIAISRISNLSLEQKIEFFKEKFVSQWSVGDFSGSYWAALETDMNFLYVVPKVFQITYILILILSILSIFDIKTSKETVLLYTLLCGFGLLFMIIETQSRYSYVISWVFLIVAVQGIENLLDVIRRVKYEIKVFKEIN